MSQVSDPDHYHQFHIKRNTKMHLWITYSRILKTFYRFWDFWHVDFFHHSSVSLIRYWTHTKILIPYSGITSRSQFEFVLVTRQFFRFARKYNIPNAGRLSRQRPRDKFCALKFATRWRQGDKRLLFSLMTLLRCRFVAKIVVSAYRCKTPLNRKTIC